MKGKNQSVVWGAMLLLGCSNEWADATAGSVEPPQVTLHLASEYAEPQFELSNGVSGASWDEYAAAVADLAEEAPGSAWSVEFSEEPLHAAEEATASNLGVVEAPLHVKLPFTNKTLSMNFYGNKYVPGCIQRFARAAGLRLSQEGVQKPLFDLHAAAWTENGKPCAGVYDSGSWWGFCWKKCGPSYTDLRDAVYSAALATGVAASVAWAVAQIATPVLVGGLALGI